MLPDHHLLHAAPAVEGSYDWEELPSLSPLVLRRHVPHDSYELAAGFVERARERLRSEPPIAPAWVHTMPAVLDPLIPSAPLAETAITGLAVREVIEPDVFRHFFGAAATR